MSAFNRKEELSSQFTNSSQMMLNDSSKNMTQLGQIISPLNSRKIHRRSANNSATIDQVMIQSQAFAPRFSLNGQNVDNASYMTENQDTLNSFNSTQIHNLQNITQNENLRSINYSIREINSKVASNQNQIRKVTLSGKQLIDSQLIEDQSSNYSYNKNSELNTQPTEFDIKSSIKIFDSKKNLDSSQSSSNKNLHRTTQSQQFEPTYLSDRTHQQFRISNTKNLNFKPSLYSQQGQDESTPIKQIQSNMKNSVLNTNSTPYLTGNEDKIPSSNLQYVKDEESLKDWLVGKSTQKSQPVLANEFNQQIQNQFLSFNSQIQSSNNQQLPQTEQQKIIIRHRRYRNSKELQNSDNNIDSSGNQSSLNDSNLSSQLINSQNSHNYQNKPVHNPSIFNPQNTNYLNDSESSQDQTKSVQIQQKYQNSYIPSLPSQNALKQILQTSSSNSPLTSIQPPDLFQLQKRGHYKPRQNKLQQWMNETNNELSQSNDQAAENSYSFDYNKKIVDNINQEIENQLAQSKYQPSAFEEQNRNTKSKFLPQINEKSDRYSNAQLPSSKKNINNDTLGLQNQQNLQIQFDQNLQNNSIVPRHKSSQSLTQYQNIQESINIQSQEIPAKKKIKTINLSNDYINRRMSEPRITVIKTSNQSQELDLNLSQNLQKSVDDSINGKFNSMKQSQSANQSKSINLISNSNINSMKNSFVKEVKSILKNKTETSIMSNKQSLRNIDSITDNDFDESVKVRHSYASTKIGNSQSTIGGISFSKDLLKSQVLDETISQKNHKSMKKVNFQERVSIVDLRTNEKQITSITKLQNQSANQEMKSKQIQNNL